MERIMIKYVIHIYISQMNAICNLIYKTSYIKYIHYIYHTHVCASVSIPPKVGNTYVFGIKRENESSGLFACLAFSFSFF